MKKQDTKWYLRYELVLAALCAFVYLGLVVGSLGRSSVWHDEGYSAVLIENDYAGIVERTAKDVHPPLYYLLLKTWSLVLGDGVAALRMFSAVCMLAAILVIWRIVRKLYGQKAGLVALAAMSVGPFLVRYGQEMRMYGLTTLIASLATYVYLKTVQEKDVSWRWYAVYGLLAAAGMYTQYFFILVPAAHLLHRLSLIKGFAVKQRLLDLKPYLISGAVLGALFVPWLPTVKAQFSEVQGSFWIPPVSVETLTSTPIAMSLLKKQFQMTGIYGLVAVAALAFLIYAISRFMAAHKDRGSRLLSMLLFVPPLLLFVLSLPPLQPSYQDRYMAFIAPLFYSVIALGVLAVKDKRVRAGIAVCALLIAGFGQWNNYQEGNDHGWQPAPYFTMDELIDQVDTADPVYATSLWTYFDARTTLKDRGMSNEDRVLLNSYPTAWLGNWSALYERPELIITQIPTGTERFWLIDESGTPQYHGTELDGYTAQKSYRSGYAVITEYSRR